MAMSKQRYYDMSTMLLKVAATMSDALVNTKVQHRRELYFPVDRHLISQKFLHYCCYTAIVGITGSIVFGIKYGKHVFITCVGF